MGAERRHKRGFGMLEKLCLRLVACCSVCATSAVWAQDRLQSAQVSIELNNVSQVEAGCQLTFLTSAKYEQGVDNVLFETALDGAVALLTLFDFGSLPPARPRVRQFVVPGQDCSSLGRILINGTTRCSAPGLDKGACEAGLSLSSRSVVELIA